VSKDRCLVGISVYFVQPGEIVGVETRYVAGEVDEDGVAVTECALFDMTHIGESVGGFTSSLDFFVQETGFDVKEEAEEVARWHKEALRLRDTDRSVHQSEPICFVLAYDFWSEESYTDCGTEYDSGIEFVGVVDWGRLIASLPLRMA